MLCLGGRRVEIREITRSLSVSTGLKVGSAESATVTSIKGKQSSSFVLSSGAQKLATGRI